MNIKSIKKSPIIETIINLINPRFFTISQKIHLFILPLLSIGIKEIAKLSFTIIGIGMFIWLNFNTTQEYLSKFKDFDSLFINAATMIGTIIALIFSLAIIPIQRAVENCGSAVTKLYMEDRTTIITFLAMSGFCILFFIMGPMNIFELSHSRLFALLILLIAITFDILREYYAHIIQLLSPEEPIKRLKKQIKNYVDQVQKTNSALAESELKKIPKDKRTVNSKEDLEITLYYNISKRHYYVLNSSINRLLEILYKSISKVDYFTSELAIDAMTEIVCYYWDIRKNNLYLYWEPSVFMVYGSDINTFLTPVYEHFRKANTIAVSLKAESVSIKLVKAYGDIVAHIATVGARKFPPNAIPLIYEPIGYLKMCVDVAQRQGFVDVALEGSRSILDATKKFPENTERTYYLTPIEEWNKIVINFLSVGNGYLANEVLKDIMNLLYHLFSQKHSQYDEILSKVLEKMKSLIPLLIANEKPFLGSPFAPYAIENPTSILYFIQKGAEDICSLQKGDDKVDRYLNSFVKMNEVIQKHFRTIADAYDLSASFLFWYIVQTIKQTSIVYLKIIKHLQELGATEQIEKLINQILWYLSFFWASFAKASKFNLNHCEEACDALAYIGILYYDNGYIKVTENCISNLKSILNSYYEKTNNNPDPYKVADIFVDAWHINLLAESQKDEKLSGKVKELYLKPGIINPVKWDEIQEAFELRKRQLVEDLEESNRFLLNDNATSLLGRLLKAKADGIKKDF